MVGRFCRILYGCGYKGQFIFVVPEENIVVVFTSDLPGREFAIPRGLLQNFIIPAAESAKPPPSNTDEGRLMINLATKNRRRRSEKDRRRSFLKDRRAFLSVVRIPDRRNGRDRRSWSERRSGVDRRRRNRLKGI